jgi:hypothetical protein
MLDPTRLLETLQFVLPNQKYCWCSLSVAASTKLCYVINSGELFEFNLNIVMVRDITNPIIYFKLANLLA